MEGADLHRYIKRTEMLISPRAVGRLYQRAEMLGRLPARVQRWVVRRASQADQYIGFVVEPYAFFLAYEIEDMAAATRQLPAGYELVPTAMFEGSKPRPSGIIAAFNVHTSVFWGTRVEFYLIAEHTRTGMLSWVICDYESNTISYDPGQSFSGSSTPRLGAATMRPLDQRLWLEGNLSVDYGGRLADRDSVPFGLVFDPDEVAQALHVPLDAVDIAHHTFGDRLLARAPFEACVFPFAQHFQSTSFPETSAIKHRDELEQRVLTL